MLNDRALLVRLSISCPTFECKDRRISTAATEKYKSSPGATKGEKKLVTSPTLDFLQSKATEIRQTFKAYTLNWGERSERLLVAEYYGPFQDRMRKLVSEFNELADQFNEEYPGLVQDSAKILGELFNEGEYPGVAEVRSRFKVSLKYLPVPSTDVRCNSLSEEDKKVISDELREAEKEQLEAAVKDIWQQVEKTLKHARDAVGTYSDGKRLHQAVLDNVVELGQRLNCLNIHKNPELEQLASEMANMQHDKDELREVRRLRDDYVKRIERIMGMLPPSEGEQEVPR